MDANDAVAKAKETTGGADLYQKRDTRASFENLLNVEMKCDLQ